MKFQILSVPEITPPKEQMPLLRSSGFSIHQAVLNGKYDHGNACRLRTNMSLSRLLTIIMVVLFTAMSTPGYSQHTNDSAKNVIRKLDAAFRDKKLSEKSYLDSVNLLMRSFMAVEIPFTNRELLQLLLPYRTVIWAGKSNDKYKRTYYGILSNQAQMTGRDGEMLYYAKKLNDLEQQDTKKPSITALTVTAGYYNTANAYSYTQVLYNEHKSFLQSIPQRAKAREINADMMIQSGILLDYMAQALYNVGDTANGIRVEGMIDTLGALMKRQYSSDTEGIAYFGYFKALTLYEHALAVNAIPLRLQAFRQMEQLLSDSKTPQYLKQYIEFALVDNKLAFFLKTKNNDSTAYYLDAFDQVHRKEAVSYNLYNMYRYKGQALYNQGLYRQSADTLQAAIKVLDSSRSVIVKDIKDMMYARAEADEKEIVLAAATKKQVYTEKKLQVIIIVTVLTILLAVLLLLYLRQRQKSKFLQFKLNIARNLHDETNPALLYAKALAKMARAAGGADKTELEQHIEHTMGVIRSLSHDLKSDKLKTIDDLYKTISESVQKLNTDNSFNANVTIKGDKGRLLSHHQFSNLKSILLEAITNTIKHADFSSIDILMHAGKNKLDITYKDNGTGWDSQAVAGGIGMKNMEERITNINGDWRLVNNYPDGYQLHFSVLLR